MTTDIARRLLAVMPTLIRSVGRQSFASKLLNMINEVVVVDHVALFTFDTALTPKLECGASHEGEEQITTYLGKIYIKYFYFADPNLGVIKQKHDISEKSSMLRLRAVQIKNREYREQIYDRYKLRERLSFLGNRSGYWYTLNLYRQAPNRLFTKNDIDLLQQYSDLIIAAVEQHLSLISPDTWGVNARPSEKWMEELVSNLGFSLTNREIQVCARALSGLTRNGIALDLNLKPSTVATLSQRAYHKLNISHLNELFALCLRALTNRHYSKDNE